MSLVSELREDIRLARLNNPRYELLFRMFDFARGLFKLVLFAAFCLGIWHILYGMNDADTNRNNRELAVALSQQDSKPETNTNASQLAELTPERIDMLKQFAKDNRPTNSPSGSVSTLVDVSATDAAEGSEVAKLNVIASSASQQAQTEPQMVASISDDVFNIVNKVPARKPIEAQQPSGGAETTAPEVLPTAFELGTAVMAKPLDFDDSDVLKQLQVKMQQPGARLNGGSGNNDSGGIAVAGEPIEVAGANLVSAKRVDLSADPASDFAKIGAANDGAWILKQNPARYTIQIGSTTNRPFLVKFAKQLPANQPYSIYQYVFRDQPEYGLGYGLFDNPQQASAALADLPQEVRRYGAFTRKIEILHRQIERLDDQAIAGGR